MKKYNLIRLNLIVLLIFSSLSFISVRSLKSEISTLREKNNNFVEFIESQSKQLEKLLKDLKNVQDELKNTKDELEKEKAKNPYAKDPYTITNLEPFEINNALYGTWLQGYGERLYRIEQENGINFRFIYAIGSLESLRGKKTANLHNYFGIKLSKEYKVFSSMDECLVYEANLMSHEIYKGKSIDTIARTYCPPNASKWANDVKIIMMEI